MFNTLWCDFVLVTFTVDILYYISPLASHTAVETFHYQVKSSRFAKYRINIWGWDRRILSAFHILDNKIRAFLNKIFKNMQDILHL